MILPDGPGLSAGGTDIERLPELPDPMAAKIEGGDALRDHAAAEHRVFATGERNPRVRTA